MPAQKRFTEAEVQTFARTMLKESLGLILPVTKAVNELMKEEVLEFSTEHKLAIFEGSLDDLISLITLSWCIAFYLQFYLELDSKYEATSAYNRFLTKLYIEIESASNHTLNIDIIKKFTPEYSRNALETVERGGTYLLWWDLFFTMYGINDVELPQAGVLANMQMADYAFEIIKVEVRKSARIKKAFVNIEVV